MAEDFMKQYEEKHTNTKAKRESTLTYLPTSYLTIDDALGGKGIPLGKAIDIAGEAGVGKTAFVHDIVRQAQDKNLSVVYLDIDRKFDAEWARDRAGINLQDLLMFEPKSPSNMVEACTVLMKEGLADIIIFDSISNLALDMTTLKEVLNPLLQNIVKYNTALIFLSQIRQDLKEGGLVTPRNGILDDICNIRIMFKPLSIIKEEELIIGKTVEVNVYKNDLAIPVVKQIELFS